MLKIRDRASALICVYGPEAQAIVVGSTKGSYDDPRFQPLRWGEFSWDQLVARHFSSVIGVYNLEGCVQQGFLDHLKTMNWHEPVVIPAEAVQNAERFRGRVQRPIWIGSHLPYLAVVLLTLVFLLKGAIVRRRKMRTHAVQEQRE